MTAPADEDDANTAGIDEDGGATSSNNVSSTIPQFNTTAMTRSGAPMVLLAAVTTVVLATK